MRICQHGDKNLSKPLDKFEEADIIANVVAKQSNMDAEMAELVEGARLEIVYTLKRYRGFESLSLRQKKHRRKSVLFFFSSG